MHCTAPPCGDCLNYITNSGFDLSGCPGGIHALKFVRPTQDWLSFIIWDRPKTYQKNFLKSIPANYYTIYPCVGVAFIHIYQSDVSIHLSILAPSLSYTIHGWGGTRVLRGPAPALRISRKKGLFKDFGMSAILWKKGTFFVPRYEVRGVKITLQSTKYTRLWRRVTPEVTTRTSESADTTAAAIQAEDYKI